MKLQSLLQLVNVKFNFKNIMRKLYINKEDSSNKWWSYEIKENNSLYLEWGRVGSTPKDKTKRFSSNSELQEYLTGKIREKHKKKYKEVNEEKLSNENTLAKKLGFRNKISKMLFVSKGKLKLTEIGAYDPEQYIYVEVMDSYSSKANKKITRLLLSKEKSWEIDSNITESNRVIYYSSESDLLLTNSSFVQIIRDELKQMSIIVSNIMSTVKFAAIGVRKLFGMGTISTENDVDPEINSALDSIDSSGFDPSVIRKFAAIGARKILL